MGGGISLHSGTGLLSHAGTDRTHRGGDQKDSGGQRWSHAAKSRTAGGSRTVRNFGIHVSRANRSRFGTSSGGRLSNRARELRTYLGPERPGQLVKAIPGQNSNVPITLLRSSDFSAQLAAALGLPFAFAAHFAPDALYAAAQFYRERFQPSEALQTPYLLIAAQVIAAETDAAARRLFTTPQQRFLRLIRGEPVELLPPVDSMEPLWHDGERSTVKSRLRAAAGLCRTPVNVGCFATDAGFVTTLRSVRCRLTSLPPRRESDCKRSAPLLVRWLCRRQL